MITQSFLKIFALLIIVLGVCFSCVKDTDFEQYDTITITPIMEVNLVKVQEPSDSFLDTSGAELPFISDQVVFDVFNSGFVVDNLTKAELVFGITNSINKAFQIKIDFYDNADELQHTFSIDIDNSPTNTPLFTEHIEVFENMNLTALKSTRKLNITISLISNSTSSVLTSDSEGSILLASKGIFYLNISS
tara:strand:- start:136 stop:708 length:573 start_codon:yes stop_codon:yes gene_type:complete